MWLCLLNLPSKPKSFVCCKYSRHIQNSSHIVRVGVPLRIVEAWVVLEDVGELEHPPPRGVGP